VPAEDVGEDPIKLDGVIKNYISQVKNKGGVENKKVLNYF